jgi:hypothetical protein
MAEPVLRASLVIMLARNHPGVLGKFGIDNQGFTRLHWF